MTGHNLPEKRRSPPMNSDLAAKAKYLVENMGLYQHQAAAILGVNQGRISEIMTGKIFAEIETPEQLSLDI